MGNYDDVIGSVNNTGSALGVVGGLISSIGAGRRQWKWYQKQAALNYDYQQKAAEEEFRRQKEMFNLTNEYNSPSAQRKRLEEANLLGPSLFDGSGPSEASMPNVSTPGSSAPGGMLSPMPGADNMARYVGIARQIAEINNINASTRRTDQQTVTEQTQQRVNMALAGLHSENKIVASYQGRAQQLSNMITEATMQFEIGSARVAYQSAIAGLFEQQQRIQRIIKENALTDQQLVLAKQAFWTNVLQAVHLSVRIEAEKKGIELTQKDIDLMSQLWTEADIRNKMLGREWQEYYGGDDASRQFENGGLTESDKRTPYGYDLAQNKRDYKWTPWKNISSSVGVTAVAMLSTFLALKKGKPSSGSGLWMPSSTKADGVNYKQIY